MLCFMGLKLRCYLFKKTWVTLEPVGLIPLSKTPKPTLICRQGFSFDDASTHKPLLCFFPTPLDQQQVISTYL